MGELDTTNKYIEIVSNNIEEVAVSIIEGCGVSEKEARIIYNTTLQYVLDNIVYS